MQQLAMADSAFVFMETPRTPAHLNMVNIYDPSTAPDGPPSFAEICAAIESQLPSAPPFRRKLVRVPFDLDYPYWVEDADFDLEFHMRHIALPAPGDWGQFRTQVGRLVSRPLDLARPPWEMTVIEGLDAVEDFPPGCFATVLKVHHAAIDGQSGVQLISAIHTTEPEATPEVPRDPWRPEATPNTLSLLQRAGLHSITRPAGLARLLAENGRAAVAELFDRGDADSESVDADGAVPRTRLNGSVSSHRVWDEVRCPLDDLKRVRRVVPGATINDVCLTVVAESMRRYLDATGELPDQSLVAMAPISTRTPDQAASGGNQISMMRPSLHTDIIDPIERLAAIARETSAKKAAQNGVVMPLLLDVVEQLPGALMGVMSRAVVRSPANPVLANTIVTNVPGSPVPLYFLGAKIVRSTGAVPLMDGVGLFHCVSSFCGEFVFMFTACPELLPDIEFYRACLQNAILELVKAADDVAAEADG